MDKHTVISMDKHTVISMERHTVISMDMHAVMVVRSDDQAPWTCIQLWCVVMTKLRGHAYSYGV